MFDLLAFPLLAFIFWITICLTTFFTSKTLLTKCLLNKRFKSNSQKWHPSPLKIYKTAFKPTVSRYTSLSIMSKVINLIRQNPFVKEEELILKFSQAGWPSYKALWIYSISKAFCLIFAIDMAILILERPTPSYTTRLAISALVLILGWFAINIVLNNSIKKRFSAIDRGFTQALDLIIVCVGSGIDFTKALERVAKEMVVFNKDTAQELGATSKELTILLDRKQALLNLTNRVPTHAIKSFVTVISQSFQQGTPILQSLTLLAKEQRQYRLHAAEVRAAKLPSTVAIPLVLFMLPSLLLIILGPPLSNLLALLKTH